MMEATLNDPQWSRMFMVRAGPLPELYPSFCLPAQWPAFVSLLCVHLQHCCLWEKLTLSRHLVG